MKKEKIEYYWQKRGLYYRTFCGKCVEGDKPSTQIKNEKDREWNCFDCGEKRPINKGGK